MTTSSTGPASRKTQHAHRYMYTHTHLYVPPNAISPAKKETCEKSCLNPNLCFKTKQWNKRLKYSADTIITSVWVWNERQTFTSLLVTLNLSRLWKLQHQGKKITPTAFSNTAHYNKAFLFNPIFHILRRVCISWAHLDSDVAKCNLSNRKSKFFENLLLQLSFWC